MLYQSVIAGCLGAKGIGEERNDRKATDCDYLSLRVATILDFYYLSLGTCPSFPLLNAGQSGVVRTTGLF